MCNLLPPKAAKLYQLFFFSSVYNNHNDKLDSPPLPKHKIKLPPSELPAKDSPPVDQTRGQNGPKANHVPPKETVSPAKNPNGPRYREIPMKQPKHHDYVNQPNTNQQRHKSPPTYKPPPSNNERPYVNQGTLEIHCHVLFIYRYLVL